MNILVNYNIPKFLDFWKSKKKDGKRVKERENEKGKESGARGGRDKEGSEGNHDLTHFDFWT